MANYAETHCDYLSSPPLFFSDYIEEFFRLKTIATGSHRSAAPRFPPLSFPPFLPSGAYAALQTAGSYAVATVADLLKE